MIQLWNDLRVAAKRKCLGDKYTMVERTRPSSGSLADSKDARVMVERTRPSSDCLADSKNARVMVEAQNSIIADRLGTTSPTVLDSSPSPASGSPLRTVPDEENYDAQREEITKRERALGFDYACYKRASKEEIKADKILQRLKKLDKKQVYDAAEKRAGHAGQMHKRRPGDHLLSNVDLVEKTEVFRVARKMPKGGHLHIHFNACLKPQVLLDVAKEMDQMFIKSDIPLTSESEYLNFERCAIQFSILSSDEAGKNKGDLYSEGYKAGQAMEFEEFLHKFPKGHYTRAADGYDWLLKKLVFDEDEAHGKLQTSYGAWEKFNARTKMMKGLFNYEKVYRIYTRALLEDFMKDNIQYAEIRPNFMPNNQLWTDDGEKQIDNWGIMKIIIEEYKKFQGEKKGYFAGLKVIYCTPRSFDREQVKTQLDECLAFKKEWPWLIAGSFPLPFLQHSAPETKLTRRQAST